MNTARAAFGVTPLQGGAAWARQSRILGCSGRNSPFIQG